MVPQTRPSPGITPPPERSLADWLRLLLDGWPALVLSIVIGIVGALVYTSQQKTSFGATYTLVVSPARGFLDPQNADQLPALADTVSRLLPTEPVLANTATSYAASVPQSAEATIRRRQATASWIKNHVSAVRQANSAILQIGATAPTQQEALDLANAAGRSLARLVNERSAARKRVLGGLDVTELQATKDGQLSPTRTRNLLIGLNAGLLVGILLAYLVGSARRRLRSVEEISDELRLPVLATMRLRRGKRLSMGPGFGAVAERLLHQARSDGPSSVLVTGLTSLARIADAARAVVEALESYGACARVTDSAGKTGAGGSSAAVGSDREGERVSGNGTTRADGGKRLHGRNRRPAR